MENLNVSSRVFQIMQSAQALDKTQVAAIQTAVKADGQIDADENRLLEHLRDQQSFTVTADGQSLAVSKQKMSFDPSQIDFATTGPIAGLTLQPAFQRETARAPLYQTRLAPGTQPRPFFSENDVPLTAMVLNSKTKAWDSLSPGYIARAAVSANPRMQLIVPTDYRFDSTTDPRYIAERARIARQLGVPDANIKPVRSDMGLWPQDEFMAGFVGGKPTLTTPVVPGNLRADSYRPQTLPDWTPPSVDTRTANPHWNWAQETRHAAADMARELGIQHTTSNGIARGGDTHVITRPDGQQAAFFSLETVNRAAKAHGINTETPAGFLLGLEANMRELRDSGLAVDQMAIFGRGKITYREALATLKPEAKAALDPQIRRRFEQMGDLPLPQEPYSYHTDLAFFTPDGQSMFVNETTARSDPALAKQLKFFGYQMRTLPSRRIEEEQMAAEGFVSEMGGRLWQTYMNMVMGKGPDGKPVILMPTEAMDPTKLTARDQQARQALLAAVPEARIIPIGGRSALIGTAVHQDGTTIEGRDWGTHCMSNVVPFILEDLPEQP